MTKEFFLAYLLYDKNILNLNIIEDSEKMTLSYLLIKRHGGESNRQLND